MPHGCIVCVGGPTLQAPVQISAASEKGRIRRYLTERKGLPCKRRAQLYL
jgi:hypothetical protein